MGDVMEGCKTPGASEGGEPDGGADGRSVLHNRRFLLLWLAQAISQTAQNAIWFGLMVVVEEATRSTTQLGLAVLTTILPSIFLGMIAGVFVDRMNKKSVLVTSNALRGLAVLGYLLYGQAIYFVYLVNLLFCSISQFFGPAEAATIPQLVPKRQLITANSLFNLTFTGSQMAGLVLIAPPLIKLFGPQTLFVVAALAYLGAAALVWLLPPSVPHRPLSELRRATVVRSVVAEVKEGWSFIESDQRTGLAMVHLTLVSGLMLVMSMLAPRYVVDVLAIRADDAVYIFAPAGLGIIGGTLLISRLAARFGKVRLVDVGLVIMGGCMLTLAALRWLSIAFPESISTVLGTAGLPKVVGMMPAVLILAAVIGFNFALVTIPAQTVIMERAPASTRGRIFAVQMMLGNLASVFPLLFLGGVADVFGIDATMGVVGAIILAVAIHSVRRNRRLASGGLPGASAGRGEELHGGKAADTGGEARWATGHVDKRI